MKKSFWLGMVVGALLWTSGASAQVPCLGDCDGDGRVTINELILGVNIALNASPASVCPPFDPDGNGMVVISDLIAAVNNALNGCPGTPTPTRTVGSPTITPTPTATVPTPTPTATSAQARCGNNVVETGEICDDGNSVGGDDCAANCTPEDLRLSVYDPLRSKAIVQTDSFPVEISCTNPTAATCLTGQLTLRTGQLRDETVRDANGEILFEAGQIPVVTRADEVDFRPIVIPGVGCACTRGVVIPEFGEGVSGAGTIGCGDAPLNDISYELIADHNTNPGSPGNRSGAMPNDPECNDQTTIGGVGDSHACLEGTGEECSLPLQETVHQGVCNSPRALTRSGGPAPKGSAFIVTSIQIGVLRNGRGCPARDCTAGDFGPDCIPCTDDDVDKGDPVTVAFTTATAQGAVFDVNNATSGLVAIEDGGVCGFSDCDASQTGAEFDCDLLASDPTYGGAGGRVVLAFPALDSRGIGDNVTSVVLSPK